MEGGGKREKRRYILFSSKANIFFLSSRSQAYRRSPGDSISTQILNLGALIFDYLREGKEVERRREKGGIES